MTRELAADSSALPTAVVLQAVQVWKTFVAGTERLDVLQGVNLAVRRGEIIAILGASGVGKSTLLHLLGALDRPTSGQVFWDETDVFTLPDPQLAGLRNRRIGFVFQAHHLLPEFTAIENVMMPLLIGRHTSEQAHERAKALLEDVGLAQRLTHKPGELSGGEQQRVAVARALAAQPAVVLADEPSGNLDRGHSTALLNMIWSLSQTYAQAFVIVTHDEEIGRRANRLFRLVDGHLNELVPGSAS